MNPRLNRRAFITLLAASLSSRFSNFPRANTAPARNPRLNRYNLLEFRGSDGQSQPVKTVADWNVRRGEILGGMQGIMGPLPGTEKRVPLALRIEEEAVHESYVRRLITYASEPESRTPAYLFIPKALLTSDRQAPAILCLHQTNHQLGHKVLAGIRGGPADSYAIELAERGFVTLAPAYPLLGNYQPDVEKLGYRSGTMKAIWDNIRALDLLETMPFVRGNSFGAIGHSLGGHNALFTAAFEPRLKAIAVSCAFDSFLDYYRENPDVWQPGRGWTHLRYMPRLADYAGRLEEIPFDFSEILGALAPRKVFINAPLGDTNFKWQSVAQMATSARPVFALFNAKNNLRVEHPDCGHDFPEAMRNLAYETLDS
jgi:hypothetical protein